MAEEKEEDIITKGAVGILKAFCYGVGIVVASRIVVFLAKEVIALAP